VWRERGVITCTLEGGEHVPLRHTTVDALLVKGRAVVLSRRAEGLPEAGSWSLPGGYVDRDETVMEALEREVREEVCVGIKLSSLFAIVSEPNRDVLERQNVSLVFLVTDWDGAPREGLEVSAVGLFGRWNLPAARDMAADHHKILKRYFNWTEEPGVLPFIM
jgi:ADP-ribose pyrophosphatase YjhB (NUDIX family)